MAESSARSSPALTARRYLGREDGIALTIDVEDWFDGMRAPVAAPQVEADTGRILDGLAAIGRHATFFVLGDLARRHPALVRRLAAAGHEVGCHGGTHRPLAELGPARFAAELGETLPRLEDLTGQSVQGFRAPFFSIQPGTAWALDVLARAGLAYDASIYPGPNDRYGWPGAPDHPVRYRGGPLVVVPLPMLHPWLPIGFSGGAYLRMLPWPLVRWAAQRREGPLVVYGHPWEFADRVPWAPGLRANLTRHPGRARFAQRFFALAQKGGPLGDLVRTGTWPSWTPASSSRTWQSATRG